MSEFSYDAPDVSADELAEISAQIKGTGLSPLSDEEREQRRIEHERWLAERQQADERRHNEAIRQQAERAAAQQAEAERQAAISRAENQARVAAEYRERTSRQTRDKSLASLLDHAISQRQFRQAAVRSAAQANARSRLSSALNAALELSNPIAPPEPTVVVVSEDDGSAEFGSHNFDVAKWSKKPRSWW